MPTHPATHPATHSPLRNQSLQELLEKLLGVPCKLFTTKCVSHELKQLGDDFRPSFLLAKKQQLHKCAHETPISAADCLLQQIGACADGGAGGRGQAVCSKQQACCCCSGGSGHLCMC
jgi:hypothetical protein